MHHFIILHQPWKFTMNQHHSPHGPRWDLRNRLGLQDTEDPPRHQVAVEDAPHLAARRSGVHHGKIMARKNLGTWGFLRWFEIRMRIGSLMYLDNSKLWHFLRPEKFGDNLGELPLLRHMSWNYESKPMETLSVNTPIPGSFWMFSRKYGMTSFDPPPKKKRPGTYKSQKLDCKQQHTKWWGKSQRHRVL